MRETVYGQDGHEIGCPDEAIGDPKPRELTRQERIERDRRKEQWENQIQSIAPKSQADKLNILIGVYRKCYKALTKEKAQERLSTLTPDGNLIVAGVNANTEKMHWYRRGILSLTPYIACYAKSKKLQKEIAAILKETM